jgi:Flp pilus assembly protein TadG
MGLKRLLPLLARHDALEAQAGSLGSDRQRHDVSPRQTPAVSDRRKRKQSGSELIEFTLCLLPMLGIVFLIIDIAWGLYGRSSLQHAVKMGVRYAITSQTLTACNAGGGQVQSIKKVVQVNAMGFLDGTNLTQQGAGQTGPLYVNFYNPNTFTEITDSTANSPGNIVSVSVQGYTLSSLLPLYRGQPLTLSARSMDVIGGAPLTGIPCL